MKKPEFLLFGIVFVIMALVLTGAVVQLSLSLLTDIAIIVMWVSIVAYFYAILKG